MKKATKIDVNQLKYSYNCMCAVLESERKTEAISGCLSLEADTFAGFCSIANKYYKDRTFLESCLLNAIAYVVLDSDFEIPEDN